MSVLPCARVGCSAPAVAAFAFDAAESLVWLDPLAGPGQGAGLLCEFHADRLTPPRGWNLQDRRGPTPRLWAERPPSALPLVVNRRERRARSRPHATPAVLLPFDEEPPGSPSARPDPGLDHVLDAHTPLLARAFAAARHEQRH
ncbi:MAG: DUF3499 family protein [Acidimicrobiia bacterium]